MLLKIPTILGKRLDHNCTIEKEEKATKRPSDIYGG
jgi:hypothetical protein